MNDSLTILKNQLKELKLKHLAAQIDQIILESRGVDKSYSEYLQDVLAIEIEQRRKKV